MEQIGNFALHLSLKVHFIHIFCSLMTPYM